MELSSGWVVLFGCLIAYLVSTVAKNLLKVATGRFSWKQALGSGGMPSSHSATLGALCTGIWLFEGVSITFALSFVLLTVVVADALQLRRYVGFLAASINKYHSTKHVEQVGHTPLEVFLGLIIGVLSAILAHSIL